MKYFITFGNKLYYNAIQRIVNEAKSFNVFDNIIGYTDTYLQNDTEFWKQHGSFIEKNRVGYGCWLWKSYLVMKTLSSMKDDDILIYADAGCHLNIQGHTRLQDYFRIVEESQYGILSFQMSHLPEKQYTKSDVLKHFDTDSNSGQLVGGIFIIKKCPHVNKIVELWYKTCCDYHLLDNSPSIIPNDKTFIDNRYDQSIWSVIRKKYGTEILEDETYSAPKWNLNHPIWAIRSKI